MYGGKGMCPLFSNQVSSRLHLNATVLNSVPSSILFSTIVPIVPSENKYSHPTFCFFAFFTMARQAEVKSEFAKEGKLCKGTFCKIINSTGFSGAC